MTTWLPFFVVLVIGSLAVARLRGWPLPLATVEALAFAGVMMLVFFGETWAIPYTPKAMLIASGAVLSTWALERMNRPARLDRSANRV